MRQHVIPVDDAARTVAGRRGEAFAERLVPQPPQWQRMLRPYLAPRDSLAPESLLLPLLIWAAVAEFLLLRVFLRLGPVLPAQEPLLPVYAIVELVGLAAANLGLLAAAALAITWATQLFFERRRSAGAWVNALHAASTGIVLVAVAINVVPGILPPGMTPPVFAIAQPALSATALLAILADTQLSGHRRPPHRGSGGDPDGDDAVRSRLSGRWTGRWTLALVVVSQVLALYFVLGQALAGWGPHLPGTNGALFAAETAAVAAALAVPWSFRPVLRRRHVLVGVLLGFLLLGSLVTRPWIVATVSMWTVSFSLFLPGALYPVALAAGTAGVWALHDAGGWHRTAARGLLLVALAGLKLDFTYVALLALAGTLVCGRAAMSAPRRDREPAAGNTLAPEENRWDRFRSPRHAPALDTRIVTSAPFVAIIGLADRAHDAVKTFSSGMKRRLNIAAALLHRPRVLFLDEPTVGVDPQSRNLIFEQIERLKAEGMTLIDGQARIIARRVSVDHAVAGERTAGLLVLQVSLIDEHRAPPDLVGLPL